MTSVLFFVSLVSVGDENQKLSSSFFFFFFWWGGVILWNVIGAPEEQSKYLIMLFKIMFIPSKFWGRCWGWMKWCWNLKGALSSRGKPRRVWAGNREKSQRRGYLIDGFYSFKKQNRIKLNKHDEKDIHVQLIPFENNVLLKSKKQISGTDDQSDRKLMST